MLQNLEKLYGELEKEKITVVPCQFNRCKSIALAQDKVVGIDQGRMENRAEEYTTLIHEKGHFDTGAFYTADSPYAVRGQAEQRADRAAILQYIPLEALQQCLDKGIRQRWELAEHFGVTEAFMDKAMGYYKETLGLSL